MNKGSKYPNQELAKLIDTEQPCFRDSYRGGSKSQLPSHNGPPNFILSGRCYELVLLHFPIDELVGKFRASGCQELISLTGK